MLPLSDSREPSDVPYADTRMRASDFLGGLMGTCTVDLPVYLNSATV